MGSSNKKPILTGIILCIIAIMLTAFFILSNTFLNSFEETDFSPKDIGSSISQENTEISVPNNERIGEAIPIWEIENIRTYRVVSEQEILESDITDLIYKLQTRAGYYSEKAKILAENDCGTWYVKISVPDAEDNEIYDLITANATFEFIAGYGTGNAKVLLDSSHIVSAQAVHYTDEFIGNTPCINLFFTDEGSKLFADYTANNLNKTISIVYNGQVISAPIITTPIFNGQAVINGLDSYEEAEEIAFALCNGSLSVDLEEIK